MHRSKFWHKVKMVFLVNWSCFEVKVVRIGASGKHFFICSMIKIHNQLSQRRLKGREKKLKSPLQSSLSDFRFDPSKVSTSNGSLFYFSFFLINFSFRIQAGLEANYNTHPHNLNVSEECFCLFIDKLNSAMDLWL